jgi:hypothetical protein
MSHKFKIGAVVGYVAKGNHQAKESATSCGKGYTQPGLKGLFHVVYFLVEIILFMAVVAV